MASRQEQKKKLREEREAREREEQQKAAKRKRLIRIGIAVLLLVVIAVGAGVALSGGSKKKGLGPGSPPKNAEGLQQGPGPWDPDYDQLPKRLAAMKLPDPSDQIFHVHANVRVYTDGKQQKVPANIGIDQEHQLLASLHTHDDAGTVHMEAVQPYPFRLGQFFQVWGVVFTPTQLGGYHAGKGLVLQTWVNGKLVPNGPAYVMKPHDLIVVGFGKPGSFPHKYKFAFPAGE